MEGERGKAESALKGRASTMHGNHYATTESTVFTENMTATLDTDKRRGRTEMAGYSPTNLQPCSAHSSTFRQQPLHFEQSLIAAEVVVRIGSTAC